jgi:putative chitinase
VNPLTLDDLRAICPRTPASKLAAFVDPLNATFEEFEINTPARRAAFLAQAAHETGGFQWMREFASGEAYDDRRDLGNNKVDGYSQGEGARYKGRGIFQLTGESNYMAAGRALYLDDYWFQMSPELAEQPEHACRIAGWFWKANGLNALADRGDFRAITRRINGGYNGLEDRIAYHERAQEAFA